MKDGDGPIGISAVVNVDGTDNFSESSRPASPSGRASSAIAARFLQPSISATASDHHEGEDYTAMAGIGLRLRAARNTYLFVEGSPRFAGYDRGVTHVSFGFEQRAGGHVFQLNFSNGFGTTLAQVARGGTGSDDWYLGFNLSRKFY